MIMAKEDIAPYQRNLALKQTFKQQGLDLDEVMEFSPFDLDLENRRLEHLLDFVQRYHKYGSQQVMEVIEGGYAFPPIFPGISPENDWYRFELWLQGLPTRTTMVEQLPENFVLKRPEELTDDEIGLELEDLALILSNLGYGISLNDGIPPRLVYENLLEHLGEDFEFDPGGGWCYDGCSGYCPGCFQRPWCDTGQGSCWTEDEEAGKMSLIESLNRFVSASPQSLEILQKFQAVEDADFEKYKAENPDSGFGETDFNEDWKAKLN
jgi:hypothetical protein